MLVPVYKRYFLHVEPRLPASFFRVNSEQIGCARAIELHQKYTPTGRLLVEVDDSLEISSMIIVRHTVLAKHGYYQGKEIDFYSLYAKMPVSKAVYLRMKR